MRRALKEWALFLALIGLICLVAMAIPSPAHAQEPSPPATAVAVSVTAPPALPVVPAVLTTITPSTDYQFAVREASLMQAAWAMSATERARALPDALSACARYTGELAQTMCAFAATGILGGGSALAQAGPPAMNIPAPPKATTWVDSILAAPAATLTALSQFAPSIVQYLIAKVQTGSNERVAIAQSQERSGLYSIFQGINGQSMGAIQNVAQQGFITIGTMPHTNNTTYTATNSSGIGFGAGGVTYNPVTNSYNPVHNCQGGSAAPGGAGGGTTTGAVGGAGGAAPGGGPC